MSIELVDKRYTIEPMTTDDTAEVILFMREFFFKVCPISCNDAEQTDAPLTHTIDFHAPRRTNRSTLTCSWATVLNWRCGPPST